MIPLSTTTVRVERRAPHTGGGFDESDGPFRVLDRSVRAHFSTPGYLDPNNEAPSVSMRLRCDPTDLVAGDRVVDERTGEVYAVQWATARAAFMPHVSAQVWAEDGVVSG